MSRIEDGGAVEAGRDLVAELTSLAELDTLGGFWATADIHRRAADKLAKQAAEITRLRAENAGMREALEPFAKAGELFPGEPGASDYDACIYNPAKGADWSLCGDDLRRARAALSKASQAEGQTP